jgi:chemotaxis protein methyltransferase CheR
MLSHQSFAAVTDMFHRVSGIRLTEAKLPLVAGRLQKLAQQRGVANLDDYVSRLMRGDDAAELAKVVDKLTTNETYFFREPAHFDFLSNWLEQRPAGTKLRVWSGASSSGEEAYSIAMLLADCLGLDGWEIVGTDLSSAMVETARTGLYPVDRAQKVPTAYLKRWCLRGQGDYEGQLLVAKELRQRVRFEQGNLTQALPDIGQFDVIFLRNVLIYFDNPGKQDIVRRVLTHLKPDGVLMSGHAESIANLGLPIRTLVSAVYTHA